MFFKQIDTKKYELQLLKQAITEYAEALHQTTFNPQQPVPVYHTRTDLDALILAVGNLQRTRGTRE